MGNSYDSPQADKTILVDFIATHQVLVVAEIAEEPAEPPDRLRRAVESPREGPASTLIWFEDVEAKDVERLFRMPAIEDSIDANKESTFQCFIDSTLISMQTWDMAFHGATSCDLA